VLLAGGKSINKREGNMARDRRVNSQLRRQGWKVIRIWQLPSAVYAALRYQLVAKATYLRLRLWFSTSFPE
jgi:G:T-mismatch repair DNA endonuclease (very short patch repair protein)